MLLSFALDKSGNSGVISEEPNSGLDIVRKVGYIKKKEEQAQYLI